MIDVYDHEGLPFSTESDIIKRQYFVDFLTLAVRNVLLECDKAWTLEQIEVPILIPKEYLRLGYQIGYVYKLGNLRLRPETTEATYAYARKIKFEAPHCIWTHSRSARPEPVNRTKWHLHEFWQLEFQCFHKPSELDYQNTVLEPLRSAVANVTGREARVVKSETSPAYSPSVMDIELLHDGEWVEVASILLRNDTGIDGIVNLEIGFGTDRLLKCSLIS